MVLGLRSLSASKRDQSTAKGAAVMQPSFADYGNILAHLRKRELKGLRQVSLVIVKTIGG